MGTTLSLTLYPLRVVVPIDKVGNYSHASVILHENISIPF